MSVDPVAHVPPQHLALRRRVDRTLDGFLIEVRSEMASIGPDALLPIDEVIRLVTAGGALDGSHASWALNPFASA